MTMTAPGQALGRYSTGFVQHEEDDSDDGGRDQPTRSWRPIWLTT